MLTRHCVDGRADHCWHREGNPDRTARKGAKQVRCCHCDKAAWAVMRRDTLPSCGEASDVLERINPDTVVAFESRRGAAL